MSVIINASRHLLDWPEDLAMPLATLWDDIGRENFKNSIDTFKAIKHLTECGLGELWLARYPSMRKYFADFIQLPFQAEKGSEHLLESIELIRRIDSGEIRQLPKDVSLSFVPKELRPLLYDKKGRTKRNAWEMGLAIAMKDAIRSGDLFLPESKQHVSFWNFLISDSQWAEIRQISYQELAQPIEEDVRPVLTQQFQEVLDTAQTNFLTDNFASIVDGKLKLKKNDKLTIPDSINRLQKLISASLPLTRIEKLLMEVDQHTQFSQAFRPIQGHHAKPKLFYKSLMSALISQATNLGVVAMSASVNDVSVDMLRHVQNYFIREETIKAANAMIVNRHHELPLSKIYGSGTVSSSDAQRFGIRASSLLASYYPRYYGYYEKAISIYTHVSDQYSVFSTKVISCRPREALYVLDGLLENNTVLLLKNHTTDTHGYTEIIFALCHLLGFYFMPRIRDLKNQQLYRIDKNTDYGVFNSLLNKTADLSIIVEQWDEMIRVAYSLINRTAPAHIVVQRLMNSYPSDRLSKAFTNLGRIIKTQYILRYLTDKKLRLAVQRQLNKGEYRHKLPRWIFFASQGEFTVGDYEEIMNKASCLSLVSNAILYWNTLRIQTIVDDLRLQGEDISDETLSHISLLPYRHVLPNGTYFIEDFEGDFGRKPTV